MILQAREDALQGIVKDSQAALSKVTANKKKYSQLLTDLILQVHPYLLCAFPHTRPSPLTPNPASIHCPCPSFLSCLGPKRNIFKCKVE